MSWATPAAGKRTGRRNLNALADNPDVEWVAPVYQAEKAEKSPQSYFAINPTVLLLPRSAGTDPGEIAGMGKSAFLDERRSSLLKDHVVIRFPNADAIDIAQRLAESAGGRSEIAGFLFENIPYISPLCCSCSGTTHAARSRCAPSTTSVVPNDAFFTNQWGLQQINAPRAWAISQGDPNVAIAVLDQGVDLAHPDLNLWPVSYSTVTHTNDGSPVGNHGTPCAGIIAGKIDNSLGVAGVAGKCRVMAIATNFADTEVAEGLYFAADNGARVVSMSFGVYPSWMVWNFPLIEAALQYCYDKNVVLVAASGNENQNVSRFPGSDARTLCVGGSNRSDLRKKIGDTSVESWWGACYGPSVEVVAPCLEIPTTDRMGPLGYSPTDYSMSFNGTSSATPHVAGLAGLLISTEPAITSTEVRRIICETADKVNAATYAYTSTAGKPFGTWNDEVGYGRINAERALLVACSSGAERDAGPCDVELSAPDACCVSPCDPPWRPDDQCIFWYESRFFRTPIRQRDERVAAVAINASLFIEFRVTYEHRLCLLGKQHGPLLYTVTLLPGERLTLYHNDRYRRITSQQDRFSVQTTFMQFMSTIHRARLTGTIESVRERFTTSGTTATGSIGGGLAGLIGLPSGSATVESTVADHTMLRVGLIADQFNETVTQASQITHAERSVVISTYEDREIKDITSRTIQNDNACRAVTYFVRKVVELYAVSTRVSDISYRIIAPGVPAEWHSISDLAWLPAEIADQLRDFLRLLPRIGDVVERPRPISLPTDGTVYDPELAHCCSCEPERAAAIAIQLEKQKAEAIKACVEAQLLELELERRRLLLRKGEFAPFSGSLPPTDGNTA
ncbi:MAG: S8 family serine peptidase [Gemmatimonadaceae bacterium]